MNLTHKKIATSFLWMGFERISQIVAVIFTGGVLAQSMPSEQYASWVYSFSLSGILTALTWFYGAEAVLPRLLTSTKKEEKNIINRAFFIRLHASFVVFIVTILIAFFQTDIISKYYLLGFSLAILFREPLMVGLNILQSKKKFGEAAKILIFGAGLRILLVYLWVVFSKNPFLIWAPWVIENIFVGVLIFYVSKSKISHKLFYSEQNLLRYYCSGVLIWLSTLLPLLYIKIDKMILKEYIPNDIIFSSYAIASQLNENILSLSAILVQVLGPFYLYTSKVKDLIIIKALKLSFYTIPGLLLISTLAYLTGRWVIIYIYGEKYIEATVYFKFLVFLLPLWGVEGIYNAALLKLGKPRLIIIKQLFILLIMIVCTLYLKLFLPVITSQIISLYLGLFMALIVNYFIFKIHLRRV